MRLYKLLSCPQTAHPYHAYLQPRFRRLQRDASDVTLERAKLTENYMIFPITYTINNSSMRLRRLQRGSQECYLYMDIAHNLLGIRIHKRPLSARKLNARNRLCNANDKLREPVDCRL